MSHLNLNEVRIYIQGDGKRLFDPPMSHFLLYQEPSFWDQLMEDCMLIYHAKTNYLSGILCQKIQVILP